MKARIQRFQVMRAAMSLLLVASAVASVLEAQVQTATKPIVTMSVTPHAGPGGEGPTEPIAGSVKGVGFGTHKIVIYAYAGGTWWVQPTAKSPLTVIDTSGDWQTITHLGSSYAVLVVNNTYPPAATSTDVPQAGGDVLVVKLVVGR